MLSDRSACFFFNATSTSEIYTYCHTLSLHDALPIYAQHHRRTRRRYRCTRMEGNRYRRPLREPYSGRQRSEEHTSELQSLMRISYAVLCLKKQINELTYDFDITFKDYNKFHLITPDNSST